MSSPADDDFGLQVRYLGGDVVLTVHGEVDIVTAPELGSVLDSVGGRRRVIIDVEKVTFMGAAGLGVLAAAAASGGGLEVRRPSLFMRRLLNITGLTDALVVAGPDTATSTATAAGRATAAGPPGSPGDGLDIHPAELARRLTEVASEPVGTDVAAAALRFVVALARSAVPGADGVSVSLRLLGGLATVAATDDTILAMDAHQYAAGEGPCVAAAAEGRPFHVESVDEEHRWPIFIAQARLQGINSILSAPLLTEDTPAGAINLYSRTYRAFGAPSLELTSLLAIEAAAVVAGTRPVASPSELADRLCTALSTRRNIAIAQGVVMARENVPAEEAYSRLVRRSRRSGKPMSDNAADIVASFGGPEGIEADRG